MSNTSKYEFIDLTVEKCFSNFIVVSDYQREYVWEADKQGKRPKLREAI